MTTPSELADISAAIHDDWFDLCSLEHHADRREMRLPIYFGQWKKRWFGWSGRPPEDPLPPPSGRLVIRNVIEFSVEDEADVGRYTVSHVAHDADSGELESSQTSRARSWSAARSWTWSFSATSYFPLKK